MSHVEVWKTVPGYSRYEASSLGRVRSYAKRVPGGAGTARYDQPRLLAPQTRPNDGYQQLKLSSDDGVVKTMKLHRVVLLAFVGEPLPGYTASHMNGDPADNRIATEHGLDRLSVCEQRGGRVCGDRLARLGADLVDEGGQGGASVRCVAAVQVGDRPSDLVGEARPGAQLRRVGDLSRRDKAATG
jgi:hypothetical protein